MPTYEYECKSCGHTFEAFQSMKDDPLKECPACGKEIRRIINGGTGVIFKGSGFYVTDSAHGKSSASVSSSKPSSSSQTSGSSAPAAAPSCGCGDCPKGGSKEKAAG